MLESPLRDHEEGSGAHGIGRSHWCCVTVAEQVEDKKAPELVKVMGIDKAQGGAVAMP
nr:hypothetical protein [Mesorhizobium loti]